jgi:hypothetical protein
MFFLILTIYYFITLAIWVSLKSGINWWNEFCGTERIPPIFFHFFDKKYCRKNGTEKNGNINGILME